MIITVRYTSTNAPGVFEKTLLSRDDYDAWVRDNPECTVTSRVESAVDANIVYNHDTLDEAVVRFAKVGNTKHINLLAKVAKDMKGE